MTKIKISSRPLLAGTLFLTLSGLLSRIIGFFYRIFLSHTIGAEGLGIYQLIFPIYAMTFSFTAAGIQTALSKFVAEACVRQQTAPLSCRTGRRGSPPGGGTAAAKICGRNAPGAFTYLYTGLFLSLVLSFLCTFFLYRYADFFAINILGEPRCTPLLQILSLTVPFGAIHACVNGYYYGLQKTAVPAMSQLLEQIARVGGVFLIYRVCMEQGRPVTINIAVWGLVIGEIVSVLYCVSFTKFQKSRGGFTLAAGRILSMTVPLTANRVFVNLMQSAEAILIPSRLRLFGYSQGEALSVYGVLTGMAMPMVLFPSVITNSVSVMLLPAISEAQAKGDHHYIQKAVKKSCFYCVTLGFCCTLGFLLLGKWLGIVIFANEFAGTLIMILGWICPFLYLTTTLSSILNGLGKTTTTFLLNLTGSGIRILFVLFLVPLLGIKAYLWGMLVSDLMVAGAAVVILWRAMSR